MNTFFNMYTKYTFFHFLLGYDSGAHSPTSETPSTPPSCLMLPQIDDGSGSSTGDVISPRDPVRQNTA